MNAILITYLGVNTWTDIRRREINLCYTGIFLAIGFLYQWLQGEVPDWKGILPGCVLLLLSLIWKKQIGSGDGVIVMAAGCMCGLSTVWSILVGGFLLAAIVGTFCWILGRGKDMELPFVPFFFCSYLLEYFI